MPSHILHCSSSRSLDRHNKLQCNKTKVQTNAGYLHETNALHAVFCTVEYRSKKHFHPHSPPPKTIMQQLNFLWSSSQVKKPMFKQAVPQEQGYQGSYCFKTPSTP